ncbi:MAG: Crp/Fnr family transcriptional regulator [Chloroflexota bacterium]
MAMSTRIDAALASGWFGAGLSDVTRTRLSALAELTTIETGSVVLSEGSPVDSFGVVVDGRLSIRLSVPGRGTVTVLTIEPGDCVGWSALVAPHRATSTVLAIEPTTVVSFDGAALRAALDADPELAAQILWRVLDAVSRRLTATRTQLLDLFAQTDREPW